VFVIQNEDSKLLLFNLKRSLKLINSLKDRGIYMAILLRFEKYTLPRAVAIKEKVEGGEKLEDYDIDFLKKVLSNIQRYKYLIERHPEYHDIESRAIWMYSQIIDLALKNETNNK